MQDGAMADELVAHDLETIKFGASRMAGSEDLSLPRYAAETWASVPLKLGWVPFPLPSPVVIFAFLSSLLFQGSWEHQVSSRMEPSLPVHFYVF